MKLMDKIVTNRLVIANAAASDIDWIIELENHPDNRDFVWAGTVEEHLFEIEDDAHLLLIFRLESDGTPVGYSLSRIDFKSEIFELRRIVISDKGKGYGRESIEAHLTYAFERLSCNRFWLDVYPDNHIGIKLYESLGLHRDGVLRQNYKADRGYLDQIVYSMLKSEYRSPN